MSSNPNATPGVRVGAQDVRYCIFDSATGIQYLSGMSYIDGAKSRDPLNTGYAQYLRPGVLLGLITASGKYAPSILGATTVSYVHTASVNTILTVAPATAAEIVRRIGTSGALSLTGPATSDGAIATRTITFASVNTATGEITISASNASFIVGSLVMPTDGSQQPRVVLATDSAIKVTDENELDIDVEPERLAIAGMLQVGSLPYFPTNAVIAAWLRSELAKSTARFTYDSDFRA